ncbi:Transposase IS4 family protein OS=Cyanothece sp. (strain PCC 7822) GN=Cyan7822_1129 PE=4 SV=1 [Gemmata obscuriglobus UQM 2246]|nr:Transposase IS4 family protein OS=Cyanothece sp. (strain PCC 7822) GN=Cyan7822_1129 PE=4 SV=1 [Gemmata obscuriglobus UQM 2246]
MGYPRAALFGFCVAVAAYNVRSVLKAALRAVHGEQKVREEVSGYYMALEWAMVYPEMMIALPAAEWEVFGRMPGEELAASLREWAGQINLERIKNAPPRKPTKEKTRRIKDKSPHVSTARLIDEAKKARQAKANKNQ